MKTYDLNWPAGVEAIIDDDGDGDAGMLARRLAVQVAQWLSEALTERSRASLAVSGGSTPLPFFEALSDMILDWSRVDITLADERWVDPDHADSNEALVRTYLLRGRAAAARFIGLKQPGDPEGEGGQACEAALAALHWPLDVLVLGMGNDGHTASLFPDAPELATALAPDSPQRCVALRPPSVTQARMSLTRRVLGEARHTALHLRGEPKLTTLEAAFAELDDIAAMPIRVFLKPGLQVYWSP